jgi:transcriptional regulator with PAS, ATPase and Fis domain
VDQGSFRSDLFFRIDVVRIRIPLLRERKEDIRDLCAHFIRLLNSLHHTPAEGLSAEAFRKLFQHDWPGNVRELKNTLERAMLFCKGREVPAELISFEASSPRAGGKPRKAHQRFQNDIGEVRKLLKKHKGIMKKVAQELSVDPRTLYYWLKREGHSIKRVRKG